MEAQNLYNQRMTEKYLDNIDGSILNIQDDPELISLAFLQSENNTIIDEDLGLNFDDFKITTVISKLIIKNCPNVIPMFNSKTILELLLTNCNIQSVDNFQLVNLEKLILQQYKVCSINPNILLNVVQFKELRYLSLSGYIGITINPLSQMTQLQNLQLCSCGLANIDSIRYLVNLKELDLQCNKDIIDISPLAQLIQLIVLNLNYCGLRNIEFLKYLINLEDLSLYNNQIIFISPLQELKKLQKLNSEYNLLIDVCILEQHSNFKQFKLDFQQIPTYTELNYVSDLIEYQMGNKQVIEPKIDTDHIIDRRRNFFKPVFGNCEINDDYYLTSLQFMSYLNISQLKLQNCPNIIPILTNNKIKELNLTNCRVSNFDLLQLDNLEKLILQYDKTGITDSYIINKIQKFNKLKELSLLKYNNVDIRPIIQLVQLTKIALQSCGLTILDMLQYLVNLKELNISGNDCIDISSIQHLTQLKVLNLSFCGLNNIEILKFFVDLEDLQLRKNNIMYIQPLENLKKLSKLNASINKIIDCYTIEYNPNFKKFDLNYQLQPSLVQKNIINAQIKLYVSQWQLNNSQRYLDQLVDGKLEIQNDPELLSLQFMQYFDIKQLILLNCQNIVPRLKSKTLKELTIINCNFQSKLIVCLQELEALQLDISTDQTKYSTQDSYLIYNGTEERYFDVNKQFLIDLAQFKKLKYLKLCGFRDDQSDLLCTPQLQTLILNQCQFSNFKVLINLVNLKELEISQFNKYNTKIDITPIQYLPQLVVLNLSYLNLKQIETLKYLVNLQDLSLQHNQIVYIIPIQQLGQLQKLNVEYNRIIDLNVLEQHHNVKQFRLENQERPTNEEINLVNDLVINERSYNQKMTQKYVNQIVNKTLKIQSELHCELQRLEFIENFNISRLELYNCYKTIPKLCSNTIKELKTHECYISTFEQMKLENLEVLKISHTTYHESHKYNYVISLLLFELTQYLNLKQLHICGYVGDDITPLSQMSQLNILQLISCGLSNVETLRYLVNLKELHLSKNKNIDITPLELLHQLVVLDISYCGLKSIEPLRYLINLKNLSIKYNQIVYIQPLQDLNNLTQLDASYNRIIDLQILKMNINKIYFIDGQIIPSNQEIQTAINMRYINITTHLLRNKIYNVKLIKSEIFNHKQIVDQRIKTLFSNQVAFVGQVATLFSQLNAFDYQ
ncbi:leucine-rich_repeat protein [Hexamita inflata]|uniref:Putative n=1 Tax=Hexamita inflata TaxID=28002 RepID=A0AA86TFF8_9EUKA|nr:leucine-rich repeat protein [Hexamita inflata]